MPPEHPWVCNGLIDSYRRLGQLHVKVLKEFGVAGTLVGPIDRALLCDAMGRRQHAPLLRHGTVSAQESTGYLIGPERFAALLTQWLERELLTSRA